MYSEQPENREMIRLIMTTVGRGGQGDVGQRIRDEILVVQRKNDCSGGMMEEWHQKLHNNTSPDDVVICQVPYHLFNKYSQLKSSTKRVFSPTVNSKSFDIYASHKLIIMGWNVYPIAVCTGTSRAYKKWLQDGCLLEGLWMTMVSPRSGCAAMTDPLCQSLNSDLINKKDLFGIWQTICELSRSVSCCCFMIPVRVKSSKTMALQCTLGSRLHLCP